MKVKRSFISILLCLALVLSSFAAFNVVQVSAADTAKNSTGNSNTGELVLKAWNWPISVIQSNLDAIADAGFTVIETSAVNGIVGSGDNVTDWYQFYQPTNYNIGNKIGTEAEFKSLCSNAKAKGIKIIVDVVLNHTTDQESMVDSSLCHWHSSTTTISNWDSRYDVTQYRLNGLPDLDTSCSDIQSAANTFLKKMISDGASGFRFDAAKHIELPSAYDGTYGCASDYWQNALDGVYDSFSYGEVLGGTNGNEYMNFMKITDSGYSGDVRSAIQNGTLPASTLTNYDYNADPDYLVNYVETHDNFVDGNYGMSNFQVQLAYAAMASMGNNCMYLARPKGSTSSYTSGGSGYAGTNNVYDGGDGAYLLPQVAEVNKFHNAMSGKDTYVSNVNNNNQVLAVRRGTDGVCIINAGASAETFNIYTGMPNGTYNDTINGTSFTVSGGYMSGTVNGGKIYPIYNSSSSGGTQTSDYYLVGDSAAVFGTAWATNLSANKMTFSGGKYTKVYTNVPAGTIEYKVTGPNGWGDNEIPSSGNQSVTVSKAGSTVTFTIQNGTLSAVVEEPTQTVDPEEPEVPTQLSSKLYLKPGVAAADSAKFAIWTWGTGENRWVSGTYDSSKQLWVFDNYDTSFTFVRLNPAGTTPDWNYKWNQTADITNKPSDKNIYKITDWNDGNNNLAGTWDTETVTEPIPTYDYTVKYNYDLDGTTQTITTTVEDSELTDASAIAAVNATSIISSISNVAYKYSVGSASKSGTTVTVYMEKTANTFDVNLNGTKVGTYNYLDKATVTSATETGFVIDGQLIKTGKTLTVYVTGDIDITTDSTAAHKDSATINLTASYISDTKVSYEFLSTANVDTFERMGVVFAKSAKATSALKTAINNVTSGTAVSSGIAVHNSSVDWYNESGLYQFRYGPSLSVSSIPSGGATLYFYTYAVKADGTIVLSDAKNVSISNSLA